MSTDTDHILKLAEIIREVDGSNRLGAAALAEAILSHPGSRWSPVVEPEPEGPTLMEIIALADEIEAEELGQVDLVRRALARWGGNTTKETP